MSSASSIDRSPDAGPDRPGDAAPARQGGVGGFLRQLGACAQRLLGRAPVHDDLDLSDVRRVVFVCTSNLHRSAFAQAAAELAGLNAASFGLHTATGQRTVLATVRAAAALGVPLDQHRATHRRDFVPAAGDLYLAMEPHHAEELLALGFAAQRVALLGQWSPRGLRIPELRGLEQPRLRRCFECIGAAVEALAQALDAARAAPSTVRLQVH
ncbi:arsenate reductase/protein-tyrosine-phosphatase family protein [Azohydromonas aeria]|uniref:arsenate reductase/protein-tyrosine-phosphatase family protein n=1 Tax=Azohydromonas aeria TaxID=2590212 RepID=UPI0012F8FA28|nr:phosphotyrosine protein phosphatase [Azohydromonas aeria]